jgi:hypothetical protein
MLMVPKIATWLQNSHEQWPAHGKQGKAKRWKGEAEGKAEAALAAGKFKDFPVQACDM